MYKAIMEALQSYPFEYQMRTAYGFIDGFEVNYSVESYYTNNIHCQFSAFTTPEKKRAIVNRLYQLHLNKVEFHENNYGITYTIKSMTGLFNKKTTDTIMQINAEIVSALQEEHALDKDYSPVSGKEMDYENSREIKVPVTNFKVRLLKEEVNSLNNMIDTANKNFSDSPNNYGKGFLGVLVGTLSGLALMYIFTFILGIISAWAPILAVYLGIVLYKKFGGKPTWVMIIMNIVVNLVALLGFMYILYLLIAVGYVTEAGIHVYDNTIRGMFEYCMTYVDGFEEAFMQDMLLTLVACLIGFAVNIYGFIKSVKRVKRVN